MGIGQMRFGTSDRMTLQHLQQTLSLMHRILLTLSIAVVHGTDESRAYETQSYVSQIPASTCTEPILHALRKCPRMSCVGLTLPSSDFV
jgi:hypothetical protein